MNLKALYRRKLPVVLFCGGIAVLTAAPAKVFAEDFRIYYVGNSLTGDSSLFEQRFALESQGYTVFQGQHIECGKNLDYIVSNADTSCAAPIEPFGRWKDALTDFEWDAVSIQAFRGGTALDEIRATEAIIDTALSGGRNRHCIFYLYLSWPRIEEGRTLMEAIRRPFESEFSQTALSRDFLDYWYGSISARYPSLDIRIIPVGWIYGILDEKLRQRATGGYTKGDDLFRDAVHMNFSDGRDVAIRSFVTALTGNMPEQQELSRNHELRLNREMKKLSAEVIWYAMTSDPRTKVQSRPEARLSRVTGFGWECSFTGILETSTGLDQWEEVTEATSPFRFNPGEDRLRFFRAISSD
jgi:hypothetical protein